MKRRLLLLVVLLLVVPALADEPAKPKVAVFPLAGNAEAALRERVAFALRAKLDREGTYEAVSGVEMNEAVAGVEKPIDAASSVEMIDGIAKPLAADVAIWGELTNKDKGQVLSVKVFDFRALDPLPFDVQQPIDAPTDVRFVAEKVLEHLADLKRFGHPTEQAVTDDVTAAALWASNPNLVVNGDFEQPGHWERLYMAERHTVRGGSAMPDADQIVMYSSTDADNVPNRVLAMNLSRTAAENNGLAALSDPIAIAPDTRYRLQFRYQSAGPTLHVFVKGYTTVPDGKGGTVEREIYRRQVPPTGDTAGEWVTIVDDLNPQHVALPVQHLRVDLYAYLHPGTVMFDDVVLKAVGAQTRRASDAAIDLPTTRAKR